MKYTAQHILRLEKKGKFPKRIKIGERRVVWSLPEVLAWREQRSSKGSDTVAARIRKPLRQVLTLFLRKLRFLNNSGQKI
jgi:Prophage CP4-57 regulatory protein (AlpA)